MREPPFKFTPNGELVAPDNAEDECRQILDRWLFDEKMRICRDRWECLGDPMAIKDAMDLLRKYDTWPPQWLVYAVQEIGRHDGASRGQKTIAKAPPVHFGRKQIQP